MFDTVRPPFPLTVQELNDIAVAQLAGVRSQDLNLAAERFVCCAESQRSVNVASNVSGNDAINLFLWKPDTELSESCSENLWESPYESVILRIVEDSFGCVAVEADFDGRVSCGAAKAIMDHLRSIFPFFLSMIYSLADYDEKSIVDLRFPPLSLLLSPEAKNLFAAFVGWGFHETLSTTAKKNRLDLRIANAISLLKSAHQQERPSIGAALYFSAIESLVCSKKEGIVDELSRHVASLLQPIGQDRPAAIKAVKDLYNYRSTVLHGEPVDEDRNKLARTRRLAAAVVSAAIEWKTHRNRMEDAGTRDDFLEELRTNSTTGERIVGVPETYHHYVAAPAISGSSGWGK